VNFMIESTSKLRIKHSHSWAIVKACRGLNWDAHKQEHHYVLSPHQAFDDRAEHFVPVGSVNFVHNYFDLYRIAPPLPINIPDQLMPECFTGREVYNGKGKDYKIGFCARRTDLTIFNYSGIKQPFYDFHLNPDDCIPGEWQFSESIELDAIWRAFVFQGKMVGLQRCSGDISVFPCPVAIQDMIDAWDDNPPVAYALDVGVIEKKNSTIVLGAEHFYSIDLFGFSDTILAFMFAAWFYEAIGFKDWQFLMPGLQYKGA